MKHTKMISNTEDSRRFHKGLMEIIFYRRKPISSKLAYFAKVAKIVLRKYLCFALCDKCVFYREQRWFLTSVKERQELRKEENRHGTLSSSMMKDSDIIGADIRVFILM